MDYGSEKYQVKFSFPSKGFANQFFTFIQDDLFVDRKVNSISFRSNKLKNNDLQFVFSFKNKAGSTWYPVDVFSKKYKRKWSKFDNFNGLMNGIESADLRSINFRYAVMKDNKNKNSKFLVNVLNVKSFSEYVKLIKNNSISMQTHVYFWKQLLNLASKTPKNLITLPVQRKNQFYILIE
jgi:hypothetical protein